MKHITKITMVILALSMPVNKLSGKSGTMTSREFNLRFQKIDNKLLGTWEKIEYKNRTVVKYCQFNANGTFISFERNNNAYVITGKGNWKVEHNLIYIYHGEERSAPVKYEQENNTLIFADNIIYSKETSLLVVK